MTDPRPVVADRDGSAAIVGVRCTQCGYPVAFARPACPVCAGEVTEQHFGPEGVVFASTVVRIPVGERTPPYGLAYVDLDAGPRVLAATAGDADGDTTSIPVGARVRLVGLGAAGDPLVEVVA